MTVFGPGLFSGLEDYYNYMYPVSKDLFSCLYSVLYSSLSLVDLLLSECDISKGNSIWSEGARKHESSHLIFGCIVNLLYVIIITIIIIGVFDTSAATILGICS